MLSNIFSSPRKAHRMLLCAKNSPTPPAQSSWVRWRDCYGLSPGGGSRTFWMGAILAPEGCQQKSLLKVDVNMFLDKIGPQGVPSLALEFCSKWRPNFWATWTLKTAYYGVLTYIWRQTRESKSSSALVPWDSSPSQARFFPRYRIQELITSKRGSDEKNILVLQPLLTSNPTPLTTEHGYSGMEPDMGYADWTLQRFRRPQKEAECWCVWTLWKRQPPGSDMPRRWYFINI